MARNPRIMAAVRVLQGKPTVYGMNLYGTVEQMCFKAPGDADEPIAVVSCHIDGGWEHAPKPRPPGPSGDVVFPARRDGEVGS